MKGHLVKIRAITLFADVAPPLDPAQIEQLGQFAQQARRAYEGAGFTVQTVRLATQTFGTLQPSDRPLDFTLALERLCRQWGFEYISLGPAHPGLWDSLPQLLAATETIFGSLHVVNPATGTIDGQAIQAAARVIRQAAAATPDGFVNLRFAALANVRPGTPFFPAAYYGGGPTSFAIATESADLALVVCEGAPDAEAAQLRLIAAIEQYAKRLTQCAEGLIQTLPLRFGGIDFSLAPFPEPQISIGAVLECLSGHPLGAPGSMAAAAVLTDAIDRAQFARCGFSGLMLPVLEDTVLAQRAAEGRYRVNELLQWSAVCGTGLDTVPLPGDVDAEALAALLFDVAALAVRLQKPLAARLMPIPGKSAGDPVHFDFAYFADSRVLPLERQGGPGLLTPTPELRLTPRSP